MRRVRQRVALVHWRVKSFVAARTHLDERRLPALDPDAHVAGVRPSPSPSRARAAARDDAGRRFRRLIAPRSAVVQPGSLHSGPAADPAAETERMLRLLVKVVTHPRRVCR